MKTDNRAKAGLIILPIISAFAIIICVGIGSVYVKPTEILDILIYKISGRELFSDISSSNMSIIWSLRLPRVLLAFFVGASLSASGAVVQSILKNPLASPYTLGVSSGASLGVAIVIISNLAFVKYGELYLSMAGLIFAVITVFLSILIAKLTDKNLESTTIVLCGMVLSLFINAILMFLAYFNYDKYQVILKWQMGNFSAKGYTYIAVLAPVFLIGLIIIFLFSSELDIMTFGNEQAAAIGVSTNKVKWLLLIVSAILTGCSVAFAGVIGFIDLIAPHIARKLFTSKHKYLVVLSAFLGGIIMVIADLLSRTIVPPRELPVGAVTAILGAPFFTCVYIKRRK